MHCWTNNYVWLIQYRLRSTVQCQEISCKLSRAKALLWTVGASYLRVEAVHVLMRARQNSRPVWFVWIESPEREWGSGSGAERCSALLVSSIRKKTRSKKSWSGTLLIMAASPGFMDIPLWNMLYMGCRSVLFFFLFFFLVWDWPHSQMLKADCTVLWSKYTVRFVFFI